MEKAISILLLSFSFFVFDAQVANAQGRPIEKFADLVKDSKEPLNGLESFEHKQVALRIFLNIDGKTDDSLAGLTEERIRTKCELRIRQAGLESVQGKPCFLRVEVSVIPFISAFAISLHFYQGVVFYAKGTTYFQLAPTWQRDSYGRYEMGSDFIISSLDQHLDFFLDEYLKANASQNK